jgi:hypothetical protein
MRLPKHCTASIARVLMFVLPAWIAPAALPAQATTVTIRGTVSGGSGAIDATLEARSRETGAARQVVTNARGGYRILGLSPGRYDLTVRAVGYRPQRRTDVECVIGASLVLDFSLTNGAVELEPTIIQASAREEMERLDASTVILAKEIERLPLNSRDVLNLASIAPGIRTYAPREGRAVPSAGAATAARFVNLYVDGMEWKGLATGALVGQPQAGSLIPQDAVREFRVYLNPYDAEYTHGASWVMNAVTHQGGNEVHGSVFAFGQDRNLVARGSFQQGNAGYRRSQIGGNVRGPIVRDRLFYSASYEGQLTDNVINVVPGRPASNPGQWDQYAGSFAAPVRNHTGMLRLTAALASHAVDAIWMSRYLTGEGGFGVRQGATVLSRDAGTASLYRVNAVQLRDRYASWWINELSLHLLDNYTDDTPLMPGVTLRYPGIQVGRMAFPQTVIGRQLGVTDKVVLPVHAMGGEHLFKAGVELTRITGSGYVPTGQNGFFAFATDTSTRPMSGQIGVGFLDRSSDNDARTATDGWVAGAYLQDEWRPTSSLTLVLGARYDADVNTLNQHEVAAWASDTVLQRVVGARYLNAGDRENDLDNLAPRLAIAWDVLGRGHSSLRAGYGVMYDRVPVFGAVAEKTSWTWRVYAFPNPGTTDPAELRRRVTAGGGVSRPNLTLLPDRMETPSTRQWSAGFSQRVSEHLVFAADYLDQHMRSLPVTVKVNVQNATTLSRPLTSSYGDIILWGSFGDATYRALLASLTYDRGSTRWSAAYTHGYANSEFGVVTTSDFVDSSLYRMQPSDADERHRLVLSGFTVAPYGLEFSAIAIAASPRPFFVTVGTDVNQSGTLEDDWPGGIRTWRQTGWENWYRTIDVRVGKAFSMPTGEVLVTVDVFNLANWSNHSDYQSTQSLLGFAEPTADYARRQAQLGVRYRF